jgi:Vps16, N-terminal region
MDHTLLWNCLESRSEASSHPLSRKHKVPMSNPTADWEKVGDRYYRKTQLYTAVFDQDLELENYIVAGAPYGGAICMLAPVFLA